MAQLSDDVKALLSRPIHAWVTTVRPDGSLHSTVIWVDVEGEEVIFNTSIGRGKERNLHGDDRVSIALLDPDNGFHYVSIAGKGRLDADTGEADADRMAKKYLGVDVYPYRQPGERRITVRVSPDHVIYHAA